MRSDPKEIRARMRTGLPDLMKAHFGAMNIDADAAAFYRSIDGQEVTLVFTHGDAFEKQDNNFWLPDDTWEAVEDPR